MQRPLENKSRRKKLRVDGPEGYGADQNDDDHAHEVRGPQGLLSPKTSFSFSIERFCGKRLEDIDVSQLPLGLHDRSSDPVMISARQYDRNGGISLSAQINLMKSVPEMGFMCRSVINRP